MAIVELVMPKMGESIMEATVLRWHKKVGDTVKLDETVLDIATDKVDSEVPSTANGVITELLYKENDVVPVGAVIAKIESASATVGNIIQPVAPKVEEPAQPAPPPPSVVQSFVPAQQPEVIPYTPQPVQQIAKPSGNNKFFSPLVLNIANSEGIGLSELERIQGTGADGRVSKKDVLQYIADKKAGKVSAFIPQQPVYNPPPVSATPAYVAETVQQTPPAIVQQAPRFEPPKSQPVYVAPEPTPVVQTSIPVQPEPQVYFPSTPAPAQEPLRTAPPVAATPVVEQTYVPPPTVTAPTIAETPKQSVEIVEMDRMRKLIAKHMVDSKHTSPHVTSFVEADVTNMVMWRNKKKDDFEKRTGTKITFTPMFIECIMKVMKKYPIINSSVEGDKIIIKNFFNIGMATALPNNNLIVPVIKNAEQLGLVGLAKAVNTLADNARNNKLKPEDIQGGTFTLTNVGSFGSLMGTPIINQPQVAILAVGVIKKKPVVIETEHGDFIGIRHMMYLSMSYDHRIIDGSVGARFLTEVAKEFENWDVNRELKLVVQEQYID